MRSLYKTVLEHGHWSDALFETGQNSHWEPNGLYSFESSLFDFVEQYAQPISKANELCRKYYSAENPSTETWEKPLSVIFYQYDIARREWDAKHPSEKRTQARALLKKLTGLNSFGSLQELREQRTLNAKSDSQSDLSNDTLGIQAEQQQLDITDFGAHVLREAMKARHGNQRKQITASTLEFTRTRDAIRDVLFEMEGFASRGRKPLPTPLVALIQEVVRLTESICSKPLTRHNRLAPSKKEFAHKDGQFIFEICQLIEPRISPMNINTVMRSLPKNVDAH